VNLTIQNSWYAEIVQKILKPEVNIVFIVDNPQILEFPPIKEEIKKNYPILKHFISELELRLLLKKEKHKIIVIFKGEKEIPYDLMSKFVIFNISHLLKEIFSKLDCEEIIKFPIETYHIFYKNYNKIKDSLLEKMSKMETHKFLRNLIPDDFIQKKDHVFEIKNKINNLINEERKDANWWGKIAENLGESMYYFDYLKIDNNISKLKSDLNDKFFNYIKEEYEDLIYDTKSHINSNLINLIFGDNNKKKIIICFDCMGFEEWYIIKNYLESRMNLNFNVNYSFSILPSETKYSSSAIFAGMVPKNIKELDNINHIHWRNEEKLFRYNLSNNFNFREDEIFFLRCLISDDLCIPYEGILDYNAIGLVFSFIDEIAHSRRKMTKSKLLKLIKLDLENSNLSDFLKFLVEHNFDIYLVSDHGNIFSEGNGINVSNDLFDKKAKRYLISDNKALLYEYYQQIRKALLVRFRNLIGDQYLLLLSGQSMFGSKNESGLTHGGISIDEVIVPFIKVTKK